VGLAMISRGYSLFSIYPSGDMRALCDWYIVFISVTLLYASIWSDVGTHVERRRDCDFETVVATLRICEFIVSNFGGGSRIISCLRNGTSGMPTLSPGAGAPEKYRHNPVALCYYAMGSAFVGGSDICYMTKHC
jgi:hypothetical protein